MIFDPVISLSSAIISAYVFLLAGLHKCQGLTEFRSTLVNYRVLPARVVTPVAYIIPFLEIVTAICLLIPALMPLAALPAALLLLSYSLAIAANLLRGRHSIDCGCLGPAQKQSLSGWLLLRNAILLGLLICAANSDIARQLGWLDWLTVALSAATGCLFYSIANQLLMNRDKLNLLRQAHG